MQCHNLNNFDTNTFTKFLADRLHNFFNDVIEIRGEIRSYADELLKLIHANLLFCITHNRKDITTQNYTYLRFDCIRGKGFSTNVQDLIVTDISRLRFASDQAH